MTPRWIALRLRDGAIAHVRADAVSAVYDDLIGGAVLVLQGWGPLSTKATREQVLDAVNEALLK